MPVRRRRAVWIGLSLLAAAGCASGGRPLKLMPGATYTSRLQNFTLIVPPLMGPGERESDTADGTTAAGVTFSDDFGSLLDVQSRRLRDDEASAYVGDRRPGTLDAEFDAHVLPPLRERIAGTAVTHRERVTTVVGPATFAVVNLPGGSTRTALDDNGKPYRPDGVRGVLVFEQLGWVYSVSVQQWPKRSNADALTPDGQAERLLADLRQAVGQMTFD